MTDNLTLILNEFEKLKGQFIITNNRIERLIAIGEDSDDWYHITFDGKELHWTSCVIRIIPLKGNIKNEDYGYLIHIAKLNDYDQQSNKEIFFKTIEEYISRFPETDKIITDICWDLN